MKRSSHEAEIVVRCPESDAPVLAALLMRGGLAFGDPMAELGEDLGDQIVEGITGEQGLDAYLEGVPSLLTEIDPEDGDVLDRFEVEIR